MIRENRQGNYRHITPSPRPSPVKGEGESNGSRQKSEKAMELVNGGSKQWIPSRGRTRWASVKLKAEMTFPLSPCGRGARGEGDSKQLPQSVRINCINRASPPMAEVLTVQVCSVANRGR